jgi:radical SAM-linked protein
MVRDKVRIRFRKNGDLRLVSHHDLMRCFERMLRRAELPYRSTGGFHPKPRLVFSLSLPLGVVGHEEVAEIELDAELPPEEVHERLARQAPAGLEIRNAVRVDPCRTGQVRNVRYRLPLPADRTDEMSARIPEVLNSAECWVQRTRPSCRRIDIRPYLRDLCVTEGALEMDLWVTPQGTARAGDVINLLELSDLIESGAVLERTRLELHDEVTISPPP